MNFYFYMTKTDQKNLDLPFKKNLTKILSVRMSVRVTGDSMKGTYTGCVTFLKFQKKLGVIMECFSTKKKFLCIF